MNVVLQQTRQLGRMAAAAPVVVRLIVGFLMFVHGIDKLSRGAEGISGFGEFLSSQGVPAGVAMAWFVTFLELVGGAMLIVGLFSRLIAVLMTLELIGAIVLVSGANGIIGQEGVGFERDLAYIMGFLAILLLGPGRPSLDHLIGFEEATPALVPTER